MNYRHVHSEGQKLFLSNFLLGEYSFPFQDSELFSNTEKRNI